jgi:molybdenum-dependent DNA-binding transcriptional regulator ModE
MLARHRGTAGQTMLTLRYLSTFSRLATAREQLRQLLRAIDRGRPSRDTAELRKAIRRLLAETRAVEAEDERLRHDCQIALCEAIVGPLEEVD